MNFYLNQQAVLGATSTTFIITFLASFLIWFMFAGLIILWFVDGRVKKEQALRAFAAALLAWVIAQMLKSLLPSVRPFLINGELPLTLTFHFDNAFPSSHTAIAFGLAITLWLHNKKLGIVYIALAFLVAVGRVFANVHYILDVVIGSMIGTMVAVVVSKLRFFRLLKTKK
ncbi:phosphatase PAP2 family protein [Patescibacteria group bacterium]|uniref:Phosphatidic acid phosphatase type 2/haloperoxidase domain-containing protein n=1 Tax=viral metagenome TaxID=1070528 RepID=A0A6M3M6C2_9ZZZZ|nr:phosphatase PAP2 family protein [Patescibacteria group bacterium]MBU0776881.1 phosphatase PAP2 family protein [Patescibacteria group bacterium]MBU0846240.1 phosphatase PAP2 family protein [Patescibacteria group bacterium]MBU0922587.1 phosphatase PAP2 family protein [Patescibacteria group bacterium]MBU1066638.1 phosphatase PAP2 family protein [Patescibacteria group bacterium]